MWKSLLLALALSMPLCASSLTTEVWGTRSRLSLESDTLSACLDLDRSDGTGELTCLMLDLGAVSYGVDGWEGKSSLESFDSWLFSLPLGQIRASCPFPDPSAPCLAGYLYRFPRLTCEVDVFSIPSRLIPPQSGLLCREGVRNQKGGAVFRLSYAAERGSAVCELVATPNLGIRGYLDGTVRFGDLFFHAAYGNPRWPLSYEVGLEKGMLRFASGRKYGPEPLFHGRHRPERRYVSFILTQSAFSLSLTASKRDRQKARIRLEAAWGPWTARATLSSGEVKRWSVAWRRGNFQVGYGSSGPFCTLTFAQGNWRWVLKGRWGKRTSLEASYSW